ncbi:MAG: FAD-binding oxidoreductase [Planctomycetes bacterium]|nr:FAD-binding oxidoreductase [Planctomycetota bacterium]
MTETDDKKAETPSRRQGRWRRWAAVTGVVLVLVVARPTWHLVTTAWNDSAEFEPVPPGQVDDASRLNQTAVAEVIDVTIEIERAEDQLAELLARARREGLRVSIAGARHSMGGHTIYPDGISVNMLPLNQMELDLEREILHVGSGALWRDIIPHLDERGWSVAVMQSNNSFSVGGSLSVNCHGWQHGRPPIASTVESLRLMKADGSIVTCSRDENAELFSLVLGGYGLFGIILDVELHVVRNRRYLLTSYVIPATEAMSTYQQKVGPRSDAAMVYARMNVDPDRFLQDVILNVLAEDPDSQAAIPPLGELGLVSIRRAVFRGSVDSDYGKRLRWTAETKLQSQIREKAFSRNQLLNEGVEIYANRQADSTDILHEYFVPEDRIELFVDRLREIIPAENGNLLNVTVRHIDEDTDTFLRYADGPMLALVMLFNQKRTDEGEAAMRKLTRRMIDAALAVGGRYYLPYRLHASPEQFHSAYPMARDFFLKKREHDPDELFQNQFYLKYGEADVGSQEN